MKKVKRKRVVEGIMRCMRSKAPSECFCCKDGKEKGHIYRRVIEIKLQKNEYYWGESEDIVRWLEDKAAAIFDDGDKVKVTIERV